MKRFASVLLHLSSIPFSIIPTQKNLWIFGAWRGEKYNDNSKMLFEYIIKYRKDKINAVWITKDPGILKKLQDKKLPAHHFYSPKGIYFSIRSSVIFVCTSWIDVPITSYLNKNKTIVQLWHGTPLRKVNLKKGSILQKIFRFILTTYLEREYDIVTTAANIEVELSSLLHRFHIDSSNIIVTGQPRNDVLFGKEKAKLPFKPKKKERIVLYLPTWRNYPINIFGNKFQFESQKINSWLKKNNAHILIKVHLNEVKKYHRMKKKIKIQSNMHYWEGSDIYSILNQIDVLITDYSSIYFDFLLLNKPVIFLIPDINKYIKDNGKFYYDFFAITAGPKVNNWNELLKELQRQLKGKDDYSKKREKINKMFNKFSDGESSRRVYEVVEAHQKTKK